MAKRISLREFQERVSQRLQSATAGQVSLSSLGVRVGQQHYLIDLTQVSEVISVPPILPVALTHDWYRGLTNIRGTLYSVTDLAHFLHGTPVQPRPANRLLLIQPRLLDNAALMVDQIIGLRQVGVLQPLATEEDANSPWFGTRFVDEQQTVWQQLHLAQLIRQPEFLQVSRFQ